MAVNVYVVVALGPTLVVPVQGTSPTLLSILQLVAVVVLQLNSAVCEAPRSMVTGMAEKVVICGGGQGPQLTLCPQLSAVMPQASPLQGSIGAQHWSSAAQTSLAFGQQPLSAQVTPESQRHVRSEQTSPRAAQSRHVSPGKPQAMLWPPPAHAPFALQQAAAQGWLSEQGTHTPPAQIGVGLAQLPVWQAHDPSA